MTLSDLIKHLSNIQQVLHEDPTVYLYDEGEHICAIEIRESKHIVFNNNMSYPKQTNIILK